MNPGRYQTVVAVARLLGRKASGKTVHAACPMIPLGTVREYLALARKNGDLVHAATGAAKHTSPYPIQPCALADIYAKRPVLLGGVGRQVPEAHSHGNPTRIGRLHGYQSPLA